jgi:two-component system OmpR family sensor kinase
LLPQKSLRSEFAFKLLPIFAGLVFGFSYLVYSMIERGIYGEIERAMIDEADKIAATENGGARIDADLRFSQREENGRFFYRLEASIGASEIELERDITSQAETFDEIQNVVFAANMISLVLIPIIAGLYSFFLAHPIRALTEELAKMNERSVTPIAENRLVPVELKPLTKALNRLLARIEGHIAYQRELFVGIAHELKTPLAVIRAKNDVTLLKERNAEKYQETLRETNRVIDEMNKMTESVLYIGRAEYAQFDPLETIDVVKFLRDKANDFALLAKERGRELVVNIAPKKLTIQTRPTLISHILQNLFGNALKFTPEGKKIAFQSRLENKKLIVETIDEGSGIMEGFDLFAPFAGKGKQKGTGLGLYLAKNAATALGADLSVKNREDKQGAIAVLALDLTPCEN